MLRAAALAIGTLVSSAAVAVPITYTFTGSASYIPGYAELDTTDRFVTGFLTYDQQRMEGGPSYVGHVIEYSISTAGQTWFQEPPSPDLVYLSTESRFSDGQVRFFDDYVNGLSIPDHVSMIFNFSGMSISNGSPPPGLHEASFVGGVFDIGYFSGQFTQDFIVGTIDTLTRVQVVPQPGSAWLMLAGLLGIGGATLSRRRPI